MAIGPQWTASIRSGEGGGEERKRKKEGGGKKKGFIAWFNRSSASPSPEDERGGEKVRGVLESTGDMTIGE